MTPGEFELYGQRFRWMEPDYAGTLPPDGCVSMIRMGGPFPSHDVEWLSRGHGNIPGFGKLGDRFVRMFLHPEADHAALEFTLDRGVLPRILHLRGTTCLHASAVEVDGGVVAFCGHSGAGKSTLAAALVSRGYSLVSDDVLPLRSGGPGTDVLAGPGLPELRLYPTAADRIGIAGHVAPPIAGQTKARWQPRRAVCRPLPLRAIYLMDASLRGLSTTPASVWPVPRPEALMDLISNSFWVHPRETAALGRDMVCLGALLRSVEVARLGYELSEAGFRSVEELIASAVKAVRS